MISAAFVLEESGTRCASGNAVRIDHPLANDKPGAIIVVTPLSLYSSTARIFVAYGSDAGTGCAAGYWHVVSDSGLNYNVIVANP